ncbi:MAG: hypothetical protein AAF355_00470 [Myxococcota bacterium]
MFSLSPVAFVLSAFLLLDFIQATLAYAQIRDPHLRWRTIRTAHFDVTYHEPLDIVAQRTAEVAERAHSILSDVLRHAPKGRTQIVLTDDTDVANGSASVLPRNTIRLFATAPDDLSPLGDYDDWLTELVTHEHTHILHLDTIGGISKWINAIFGKTAAPNSVQPRWFIEGLATHEESERTAGGRLRSTMFEMFLRMDVLEERTLRLDQISNAVDRWPRGNAWYLYGSHFLKYIRNRFGHTALRQMSQDYGRQTLPYGLNRIAARATGYTFVELYDAFLLELKRTYTEVLDDLVRKGLRTGTRVTHLGEVVRAPRFLNGNEIIYYASDGRDAAQIRILNLEDRNTQNLIRSSGQSYPAVAADGVTIVYEQRAPLRAGIYNFYDLYSFHPSTGRTRLSHGLRAQYPDVSPDGRQVIFAVNGRATRHLAIAELHDIDGTFRILRRSGQFEQVYTPHFSPDGGQIVFSTWEQGGYRDLRLHNLNDGTEMVLTHDRALDTGPCFSPDGRFVYFSSDRTGIANIFRIEIATGAIEQITNVIAGAYHPTISPDGQQLVYVGYSSRGFDLWHLDLNSISTYPASPYLDSRPPPSYPLEEMETGPRDTQPSKRYRPLRTLYPLAWSIELGEDSFGRELAITTDGEDLASFHRWRTRLGFGLEEGNVNFDASWRYLRLPTPVQLSISRRLSPRGGLVVGGASRVWREERIASSLGVSLPFSRRLFHRNSVSVSYHLAYAWNAEPFEGHLDPNDPPPILPPLGYDTSASVSWSYSNAYRTTFDISPSAGQSVGAALSVREPSIGGRVRQQVFSWRATQYLENPWLEHHVLAMRYGGGVSVSTPDRAAFGIGGFPEQDRLEALIENTVFSGVALRGYEPFSRIGDQYHLAQAEYRFPLWRPNVSSATLPAYLYRLHGAIFADYGDASFGRLDVRDFRLGIGAEVFTQFILGYTVFYSLRVGVAYGVHHEGSLQTYALFGVPF